MGSWDEAVFRFINGGWPQDWNPFLKFFSVALSQTWVKIGFLVLIVLMIFRGEKTRKAVLLALASIGIANTMTNVLKEAFPTNRPFNNHARFAKLKEDGFVLVEQVTRSESTVPRDFDGVWLRVGDSQSKGTASAHSANMAALAFVMCYFLGIWGAPWILVALLTGVSRVYTGAHYPSQVLLGWACGLFAAFVVIKTWEAWARPKSDVQSREDDERPKLA